MSKKNTLMKLLPCLSVANQLLMVNILKIYVPLRWRHTDYDGVSKYRRHNCLLSRLFRRRSKKTSKLRVTGLCARNSSVTGEFPAQRASNVENVSIWWRHHAVSKEHGRCDIWYLRRTLLTLKHRETHGCVVSTAATDALVLKHQVISILNAD